MKKAQPYNRCSFVKVTDVPGPGAYKIPSKICEGPFITIKGKNLPKNRAKSVGPGPGQYIIPENRIPAYVMGISKRDNFRPDTIKSNLPGPGSYTIPHEYMGASWKFSRPYYKPKPKEEELGPGAYDLKSTLSKKSFKISGKSKDIENKFQKIFPGPGSYNPEFQKSNSSIIIGISKRPEIKNNSIPGPGTYTIQQRPSSCTSFGRSKRVDIAKSIDCHESYDLPSTIGEGPKISIHPKIIRKTKSFGPGPAAYSPEATRHIPTFLFGQSSKDIFKDVTASPGPVYKVEASLIAPCYRFGTAKKTIFRDKDEFPGPGSYEKESTLVKSRITFKSRHIDLKDKYMKTVPGPGAYDHESKDEGEPGWSIGKASRKLEWTDNEKKFLKEKNSTNPSLKDSSLKISYSKKP
ncbi:hypothetical protein SteCoe_17721 [Stentor coeruleus]|uniref:Uncharacterized protein n=1 Tax=Stentor coeruleus TaxID=5963 RepID=A0A1R2BYE8_9CILI|nr:hypothetical protein SteCoe_17721 [Stentor coeruleus]